MISLLKKASESSAEVSLWEEVKCSKAGGHTGPYREVFVAWSHSATI